MAKFTPSKLPRYIDCSDVVWNHGKPYLTMRILWWGWPVIIHQYLRSGELRIHNFWGWLILPFIVLRLMIFGPAKDKE